MIGYSGGDGFLHRSHPYTVGSMVLGFVVAAFTLPTLLVIGLAMLAVLLPVMAGIPRILRSAALPLAPLLFLTTIIYGILNADAERALIVASRLTVLIVTFLTAMATVHPGRLLDAAAESGVPFNVSFLFASALTAVPQMQRKAGQIIVAQRCRGMRVRGFTGRVKSLPPMLVPLVVSSLESVDARTTALALRCVGAAGRRTAIAPPRDSWLQQALRWSIGITTVVLVMLRIWVW